MSRILATALLAVGVAGCSGSAPTATHTLGAADFSGPRLTWTPVDSLDAHLPTAVRVFAGRSDADTLRAWAVRLAPGADLRIETAAGRDTPSETAHRTGACVVVNGGYFDMASGQPVGLLFDAVGDAQGVSGEDSAARLASPAFRSIARDDLEYPVARGAIGLSASGVEIATARDDGAAPCRTSPRANHPGTPGADGAVCRPWPVREALGAGPVLLTDGRLADGTDAEAFFGTDIPERNPRSAIGTAPDGTGWLVVVDGRQAVSRGVTLPELGHILHDLGATDALNLDGGGSSALVVQVPGGSPVRLNVPTGYDVERPVATALAVHCGD